MPARGHGAATAQFYKGALGALVSTEPICLATAIRLLIQARRAVCASVSERSFRGLGGVQKHRGSVRGERAAKFLGGRKAGEQQMMFGIAHQRTLKTGPYYIRNTPLINRGV